MNKRSNDTADGTIPIPKRTCKAHDPQPQRCPRSRLLGLPQELRDLIYNHVAVDGDLSSLLHACSDFRTSALGRLPGANMIDYYHTPDQQLREQIENKLYVCKVNIIAEPWYSSESSLKFEVKWRVLKNGGPVGRTRISQWTVRDLSSPMARYIYWYRPDNDVQVTFEPATSGCFTGALMILRAKLFDICQVLKHIKPKSTNGYLRHDLSIHFRGGKDSHGRLRKSFWEMRPGRRYSCKRWHHERKGQWPSVAERRQALKRYTCRNKTLHFYETLMLPLLFNGHGWIAWRLTFDIEPPNKRTSLMDWLLDLEWAPFHVWSDSSDYLGPRALFDATVSLYIEHRRQMGLGSYVPRGREVQHASTAIAEQQQHNHEDHHLAPLSRGELDTNILLLALQIDLDDLGLSEHFRGIPCQEATQLRSYLLRIRNASPRNAFGKSAWAVVVPYSSAVSSPGDPFHYVLTVYRFVWRSYVEWAATAVMETKGRRHRLEKAKSHELDENLEPGMLRHMFEE